MTVGAIGKGVSPIIIQEKDTNDKLVNKRYQVLKTDKEVTAADKSVLEYNGKKYHKTSIVINGEEKLIYVGEDAPKEMSDEEIQEKYTTTPETLDGKNDGKISGAEKWAATIEGVAAPAKEMWDFATKSPAHFIGTAGTVAAIGVAINALPVAGQIASACIFAGLGLWTLGKGIINASSDKIKTDAERRQAYKDIGSGLFETVLSVIPGYKAWKGLKAARAAQGAAMVKTGAVTSSGYKLAGAKTKVAPRMWNRIKHPLCGESIKGADMKGVTSAANSSLTSESAASLAGKSTRAVTIPKKQIKPEMLNKLKGKEISLLGRKGKSLGSMRVEEGTRVETIKSTKGLKTISYEQQITPVTSANIASTYTEKFGALKTAIGKGDIASAVEKYKDMSYMVETGMLEGEELAAAQKTLAQAAELVEPFIFEPSMGVKSYLSITASGGHKLANQYVKEETQKQVIQIGALK